MDVPTDCAIKAGKRSVRPTDIMDFISSVGGKGFTRRQTCCTILRFDEGSVGQTGDFGLRPRYSVAFERVVRNPEINYDFDIPVSDFLLVLRD